MAVASLETGGQQTAPYFLNNKMTKKELQKYNDELYSRKVDWSMGDIFEMLNYLSEEVEKLKNEKNKTKIQ